ncbi:MULTISPECIES: DUF4145 domain-containing protein [Pirellulaceae]|uniref:DUF4145 domain-containing protein n=1 Tax=Pirellulaceae TaxID=2691357 RepID=UPI001304E5BF|nr:MULTISPECIES: DUF4145 domain-containing protein [Pirellulaceae]
MSAKLPTTSSSFVCGIETRKPRFGLFRKIFDRTFCPQSGSYCVRLGGWQNGQINVGANNWRIVVAEKQYSGSQKCGHCHNVAPMEILAKAVVDEVEEHSDEDGYRSGVFIERNTYKLFKCSSCSKTILTVEFYCSGMNPDDPDVSILYPQLNSSLVGLPEKVQKAYNSAQRVRRVDANSYAVQLRRTLEFICKDQQASGNTLAAKLRDLSNRNLIPDKLSEIAKHLKDFGNVGAHADDFDISEAEIPLLDSLARAVAEYIYTAPALAKQAEERFKKLKGDE